MATCELCRFDADLRESHFIPKALYRLARLSGAPDGTSPNPIIVSPTGTVQTSRQISCDLLCEVCEQRFSKRGERMVINECLRDDRSFLLRDKLRGVAPTWAHQQVSLFAAAALLDVNVDAYRYFAASMFWRGSAGHWTDPGSNEWRHSLGARYEEEFRQFLLDEGPFPPQARLIIFVANEEEPNGYSSVTSVKREQGFHVHTFHVPGIEFRMFLGNKMHPNIRSLFARWSTNALFILQDSRSKGSSRELADMVRTSPLRGKLRERQT